MCVCVCVCVCVCFLAQPIRAATCLPSSFTSRDGAVLLILSLTRASRHGHSAQAAVQALYGCTHKELVYEQEVADMKAIVAWGPKNIVITFRGTSSMKGTKMDLCVRPRPSNVLKML